MGDHMTQKLRGQGSKLRPADRWGLQKRLYLCCVSSRTNRTFPSSQGEGGRDGGGLRSSRQTDLYGKEHGNRRDHRVEVKI